jgi:hypothetical protein
VIGDFYTHEQFTTDHPTPGAPGGAGGRGQSLLRLAAAKSVLKDLEPEVERAGGSAGLCTPPGGIRIAEHGWASVTHNADASVTHNASW